MNMKRIAHLFENVKTDIVYTSLWYTSEEEICSLWYSKSYYIYIIFLNTVANKMQ